MSSTGFSRFWFVALCTLMAATWRLWLPPQWTQSDDFPAVAMVGWLKPVAIWVDRAILPSILICAIVVWNSPHAGWGMLAGILSIAFLGDQHRLQPWAYQTWLYAIVLAGNHGREASLRLIRTIAISIYFYSALGKFDFQFVHTVGQDFLATLTGWLGQDASQWSESARVTAAIVFPLFELLIALLLASSPTQRFGGWMAMAMHIGLCAILSPLGMGHSLGVLVWNAVLFFQAYVLFVRSSRCTGGTVSKWSVVFVAFVCLLPFLERRGLWDHWPSWALYSPHSSRVMAEVHSSAKNELPTALRLCIDEDLDQDGWYRIDLSKFSLDVRGVPLVPQARVQLGLVLMLTKDLSSEQAIRGVLQSPSNRWNGQRKETILFGRDDMHRAANAYWLLPALSGSMDANDPN